MRAFVAVDLGDDLREALSDIACGIPGARVTPEENLHLTLAFLGEIDATGAEALHDRLEGSALPPAGVALAGVELWGQAGVVVIRAGRDPGLIALQGRVAGLARATGLEMPRRRFRPHVTLARTGRQGADARLAQWVAARGALRLRALDAERIVLCRSELHPGGARHEVLAAYPLGSPVGQG